MSFLQNLLQTTEKTHARPAGGKRRATEGDSPDRQCTYMAPVQFEDDEHNEYADEAESNLKKRRVERPGVDSFQTTGTVGLGLGTVSKIVTGESRRETRKEEGGASRTYKDGLDGAVELLQQDRVRGVPQGGLDISTKRQLHDMLDNMRRGLACHQGDPRCKDHDANCRFRSGRRFDPVCVGIAVTRLVVPRP